MHAFQRGSYRLALVSLKSWSMPQLGDIRETTRKGDSSADLQKPKEVKKFWRVRNLTQVLR